MYSGMANYYDEIFPIDDAVISFIEKESVKSPYHNTALDIGCGTGNLSFELKKNFSSVTGVDLDGNMIAKAIEKAVQREKRIDFRVMDMTTIASNFSAHSFDLVACFGNTLVHLKDLEQINDFFQQVKIVLKSGGLFLLQILNYDHIIEHGINELPLLETSRLSFRRKYIFTPGESRILFETTVNIKGGSSPVTDRVILFPMRRKMLENYLYEAGFSNVEIFGGFDGHPLGSTDMVLIATGIC